MNVSLTLALEEYVQRKVATGLYNNASEVIRAALRLMVERETDSLPAPKKSEIVAALKSLEPELRQRGIASAAVFGSVVRGQARPDSDVDVLVDLDPAAQFDLLDLVGVKNLLADRLEVVERESLKPRSRGSRCGGIRRPSRLRPGCCRGSQLTTFYRRSPTSMGADSQKYVRPYRSVVMAQDVADSGDLPPRDLRFCCLQAVRDPAACLGDDFEIALNQLTDTPVGNEPLEVQSGGIRLVWPL